MSKRTEMGLFLLILALGVFFRFYLITDIPLGLYPDEAANGNNALEALATGDFKIFYPENNGREGLFINLQAVALKLFGNEPWALRMVSALFGTLTILGLYLVTKRLLEAGSWKLEAKRVALLSSFFLATSFWHINFSRIGFRAIMVPFFATFALYFLLKAFRLIPDLVWDKSQTKSGINVWYWVLAGVFTGLGMHTYIAFRFVPFVLLIPLVWSFWKWRRGEISNCIPCGITLFLLVSLVVASPLLLHYAQNPADFFGRGGQVSIFSGDSPVFEFLKSNLLTIGMFFVRGDCNWRHNFACLPELNPLLMIFFLAGAAVALRFALRDLRFTTLFAWLFFLSLPAMLTKEGMPHALRSIGMIPPVMILSGWGAWWIIDKILNWFETQKIKWPQYVSQLTRVKKEVILLFILVLFLIPISTYRLYFVRWAYNPNTYSAFSTDLWHLGQYLNNLPQETKKYVITNLPGVDMRGIPAPAQTVMFATDTLRNEQQQKRNIVYLNPYRGETSIVSAIEVSPQQKTVIAFLNGEDRGLIRSLQQKFPELKVRVPGDFVTLQNY